VAAAGVVDVVGGGGAATTCCSSLACAVVVVVAQMAALAAAPAAATIARIDPPPIMAVVISELRTSTRNGFCCFGVGHGRVVLCLRRWSIEAESRGLSRGGVRASVVFAALAVQG